MDRRTDGYKDGWTYIHMHVYTYMQVWLNVGGDKPKGTALVGPGAESLARALQAIYTCVYVFIQLLSCDAAIYISTRGCDSRVALSNYLIRFCDSFPKFQFRFAIGRAWAIPDTRRRVASRDDSRSDSRHQYPVQCTFVTNGCASFFYEP